MIECIDQQVDDATLTRRFGAEARNRRVPLKGSMDLTYRCNLRCTHCYAGPHGADAAAGEMSTNLVKSILDQAAEAGCLFMLLTGGEPLLRPDFREIYLHAKRLGVLVTVFTNATLVDDTMAKLFSEWPPFKVEATIYGATSATHDAVTGVPGSLERTLAGVDRLLSVGLRVGLKTMLMKANAAEYDAMEKISGDRGIKFRMDAVLFPRLSGDITPLDSLISPQDAVRIEMAKDKQVTEWKDYMERVAGYAPSDRRYDCGAGVATFHVDSFGNMFPCMMARDVSYSLREGMFAEGWNLVIPKVREEPAPAGWPCGRCDRRASCTYCPGMLGQTGNEVLRRHVCESATIRRTMVAERVRRKGEAAA